MIELHNTCHYVFIVDKALWFEKRASSCLKNEGADMATIHSGSIGNRLSPPL